MGRLNLTAEDSTSQIILDYLESNATDSLVERINAGNKTLTQCFNYIKTEAKREAINGCACISDATVFGWAMHFFEEDALKGEDYKSAPSGAASVKTSNKETETVAPESEAEVKKKAVKSKPKEVINNAEQIGFDFFGGDGDGSDED